MAHLMVPEVSITGSNERIEVWWSILKKHTLSAWINYFRDIRYAGINQTLFILKHQNLLLSLSSKMPWIIQKNIGITNIYVKIFQVNHLLGFHLYHIQSPLQVIRAITFQTFLEILLKKCMIFMVALFWTLDVLIMLNLRWYWRERIVYLIQPILQKQ